MVKRMARLEAVSDLELFDADVVDGERITRINKLRTSMLEYFLSRDVIPECRCSFWVEAFFANYSVVLPILHPLNDLLSLLKSRILSGLDLIDD